MFGASVLGAVVTAFCGPIAFLGIAVPHLCRGLLGTSDHRVLVPAVVLMGGAVALVAQIVSLLPGSAGVLPLNAVTSLIGAPVVVAVLLRSQGGGALCRMTAHSVHRLATRRCTLRTHDLAVGYRTRRHARAVLERVNSRGQPGRAGLPARAKRHRQVDAAAHAGADAAGLVGSGRAWAVSHCESLSPAELARRLGVVLTERSRSSAARRARSSSSDAIRIRAGSAA